MVWRPGGNSSVHGDLQASEASPSTRRVAPGGFVTRWVGPAASFGFGRSVSGFAGGSGAVAVGSDGTGGGTCSGAVGLGFAAVSGAALDAVSSFTVGGGDPS